MSAWDPYLDNLIARSKDGAGNTHIDKACIIGMNDGGSLWITATHANAIQITQPEAKTIAQCFSSKKYDTFTMNGVRVGGLKYQFLREMDNTVFAKKKEHGAVTLQASKTAVIIAHCPEGKQQGTANKAVNDIVEYLVSVGV